MSIPSKILKINDFIQSGHDQYTIIDVRSPLEFEEDHIPGAVNEPVLNNEERAEIGTLYKQISSFQAREAGARIIARNISSILERVSDLARQKKPFLIYCWRGGMRSKSLFSVMEMIGYKTFLLEGGYKAYRRNVFKVLDNDGAAGKYSEPDFYLDDKEFLSIHGYTGSGKTELLNLLSKEFAVIDLEKAARHRGSLLGSFRENPQPSQKMFETELFFQFIDRPSVHYLLEGESRKIGNLNIPSLIWKKMKEGKKIWVEIPPEIRAKNLTEFYKKDTDHILCKLFLLEESLGKKVTEDISQKIQDNREIEAAEILLEKYYDPLYKNHSPEANPERYDEVIHADDMKDLYEKVRRYLEKISF